MSLMHRLVERADDVMITHILARMELFELLSLAQTGRTCRRAVLRFINVWRLAAVCVSAWPAPLHCVRDRLEWQRVLVHPKYMITDPSRKSVLSAQYTEDVTLHFSTVRRVASDVASSGDCKDSVDTTDGDNIAWRFHVEWRVGLRHQRHQPSMHTTVRLIVDVDARDARVGLCHAQRIPRTHRIVGQHVEFVRDLSAAPARVQSLVKLCRPLDERAEEFAAMAETRGDGSLLLKAVPQRLHARNVCTAPTWPEVRITPDAAMRALFWLQSARVRAARRDALCI
jgi:hypothetical protein